MPVNARSWLAAYGISAPDVQVLQLQLDSRKVGAGDVFLAIPGVQQHGNQFIAKALAQGAALILYRRAHYCVAAVKPNIAAAG
jgi:UDP-N-acetylmuramoyl-L-alanyl-D-glutamate--2,6-diaminopimelate ligase